MDITDEIRSRVPEHQVLLSFNNDSDAFEFHDWWYESGRVLFVAWQEEAISGGAGTKPAGTHGGE